MIKVIFKDTQREMPGNITIRQLIADLGLNPQSVLAMKDGKLVSNETRLGDQAEIRLISVVSGG
jgi:sulfur carrier protein ThiS